VKLWISTAVGPAGQPWGTVAVVAETRENAVAKAAQRLQELGVSHDVQAEQYRQNLVANLFATMYEAPSGDFFIDCDPQVVKRYS